MENASSMLTVAIVLGVCVVLLIAIFVILLRKWRKEIKSMFNGEKDK